MFEGNYFAPLKFLKENNYWVITHEVYTRKDIDNRLKNRDAKVSKYGAINLKIIKTHFLSQKQ